MQLMAQANRAARAAWQAAGAAFDGVTSQSSSVVDAALGNRVKSFSKTMDSAGMAILFLAAAGAASGIAGGDGEDDDSIASREAGMSDDLNLAADLEADAKMNVDGRPMDADIAIDVESGVPIGWSDSITIQYAAEQAALDPHTAPLLDTTPTGTSPRSSTRRNTGSRSGRQGRGRGPGGTRTTAAPIWTFPSSP
jgi:hypothetical protein